MRRHDRHTGRTPDDEAVPFALVAPAAGGPRLTAVNDAARAYGIVPGKNLADARAILPALRLRAAEPERDARALEALAAACSRYTPKVMLDGPADLVLDITGCAHLFGGEAGLAAALATHLHQQGLTVRTAVASRQAEAWARARFGTDRPLAELPVRALRIDEGIAAGLIRLGLRRIGDLQRLPRETVRRRFGRATIDRLEALFGEMAEPFVALREQPRFAATIGWAEPIGRTGDIEAATADLAVRLCGELGHACAGARRLELLLFRVDGMLIRLPLRLARPVCAPDHLTRLFAMQLDGLDIGFGIERIRLEVIEAAAFVPAQADLRVDLGAGPGAAAPDEAGLTKLIDQLRIRLGRAAVTRLEPVASHLPERAQRHVDPVSAAVPGSASKGARPGPVTGCPRPLRLLARPRPIGASTGSGEGPPLRLDGRSILEVHGPERIEPEWWRPENVAARDYWRVVDERGLCTWVFREGTPEDAGESGRTSRSCWHVHGTFQ